MGQDEPNGAVGGSQTKVCVHDKQGVCTLHGEGALKLWRPSSRMVKGTRRGGVKTMKYEREYYFKCDLGERGRRRQMKLSFGTMKTTIVEDNPTVEDNPDADKSENVQGDS